jgi:hypothetical protein
MDTHMVPCFTLLGGGREGRCKGISFFLLLLVTFFDPQTKRRPLLAAVDYRRSMFNVLQGGAAKLNKNPVRIAEVETYVQAAIPDKSKNFTLMVQEVRCNGASV